jgi:hypothetical protein
LLDAESVLRFGTKLAALNIAFATHCESPPLQCSVTWSTIPPATTDCPRLSIFFAVEQLAPIVRELQRDGYSIRGIAAELDKRKVETPRGGSWHPPLVKRIVGRLNAGT